MRLLKKLALSAVFFGAATHCLAESTKIELGWGNLPECVRTSCNGGLICPDTIEHTPQRITAYLNLEAPSISDIQEVAQNCAIGAAAAAGVSAIIADPAAAQPTFLGAFQACMVGHEWSSMSLSTETSCEGW